MPETGTGQYRQVGGKAVEVHLEGDVDRNFPRPGCGAGGREEGIRDPAGD